MDSFKNLTILLSCCELKYTRKTHCTRWANIKKTGNHLDVCCYLKKATGQIANTHIQISVDVDENNIYERKGIDQQPPFFDSKSTLTT